MEGYEALARMRLSDLGFVSPVEFIEIAEKRILIYDLGRQVLHRTCEFIKELQADGFTQVRVAVNISGAQLLRQEFLDDVQEIIAAHGVETASLEFEVTESVLFDNFELINQKLRMIKEMGITISLDDFGTGYSSFSRLRELHIDTVKIDRYFVSKISGADDPDSILSDIISMAHKIGLTVVAEGVEDETQQNYLEQHGCDIVQGYLYAKPLSQAEAIEFIQKFHR